MAFMDLANAAHALSHTQVPVLRVALLELVRHSARNCGMAARGREGAGRDLYRGLVVGASGAGGDQRAPFARLDD